MLQYPVILALDYGTKRVGVAISRASLAEPLKILANDDSLLKNIQLLVEAEQVEKLVIGISENEMAEKTQAFIDQLRQILQTPIEVTDETLSSHTVATQLKEAKAKLSQRQKPIDDRAAAVFLQDYLDSIPR